MALVTLNRFNQYCNNWETDDESVALKNSIIEAASDIVIDYLGYNPYCSQRVEIQPGIGSNKLFMEARPITGVASVLVDGKSINIMNIGFKDDEIYTRDGSKAFCDGSIIKVMYTAGLHEIPDIIQIAVLRVGALMLQESNGNIGLTGRNFSDMSRTFLNYTNYDKYLRPLDAVKTRII